MSDSILSRDYLVWCWNVVNAGNMTNGSVVVTTLGGVLEITVQGPFLMLPLDALNQLSAFQTTGKNPQLISFCVYAVVFGASMTISLLCLYYLLKYWRGNASHWITFILTLLIAIYNIVVFVMQVIAVAADIGNTLCPMAPFDRPKVFPEAVEHVYQIMEYSELVPGFLIITDMFLVYRAWVIWIQHRRYIILPILLLLASIPLDYVVPRLIVSRDNPFLLLFAFPVSTAIDLLTTAMIAARLISHHRNQRKLTEGHSTFYMPVLTIFIESSTLSLVGRVIQFLFQLLGFRTLLQPPFVVPICTIASSLIVLRKALGADVSQTLPGGQRELPTPNFRRRDQWSASSEIPGGFESHLIQTIGGRVVDIESLDAAETPAAPKETESQKGGSA